MVKNYVKKPEKTKNHEKKMKKKFAIFKRSPIQVLTGLDAAASRPLSDPKFQAKELKYFLLHSLYI